MQRALLVIYIFLSAFLCAECMLAQSSKTATSKQKAAQYVVQQLVEKKKGKELMDDLQGALTGLMLAGTLPESTDVESKEENPDSNDDQATRRNRRNRKDREKRRNRQRRNSNTDPRRIRVRYRTRRDANEIA